MAEGFLKDYEPVEDRLREFWSDHPKGRVMTEVLHHADGVYIVKASVWREKFDQFTDGPDATGLAQDSVATLPTNMKASALEVCETSAIGRALANLGYAAKGKRPSREEMQKASEELEPGSTVAGAAQASGMGTDDSGEATNTGASPDGAAYGEGVAPDGAGEARRGASVPDKSSPVSPEQEQAAIYIRALREGPGNTQAVLQARALFETETRKVKNLLSLSVDELFDVMQAFEDKREDVSA
jgi:hypothetical protein